MPRLSVFRPNPRNRLDGWNEPFDYCRRCYPSSRRAQHIFGLAAEIDMNTEHPEYDLDQFRCEDCRKVLTNSDN